METIKKFLRGIGTIKSILLTITLLVVAGVVISVRGCDPDDGGGGGGGAVHKQLRVHPVANTANPDRRGDVIFIHGLDGDHRLTWESENEPKFYFPLELSKEFEDVGFWSVDYAASSSDWYGNSMPIELRATGLLDYLRQKGIGSKPVLFVTHSLGGLVTKQMVVNAYAMKNKDWEDLKKSIKGVAFLATPHEGSSLPGVLERLTQVLPGLKAYRSSKLTAQLKRDLPMLRQLGDMYKQNAKDNIKTLALFENEGIVGSVTVVGPGSADPGMTDVISKAIDANHTTICKPSSVDDAVYMYVKDFIQTTLLPAPTAIPDTLEGYVALYNAANKSGGSALVTFSKEYFNSRIDWIAYVDDAFPASDENSRPYLVISPTATSNDHVIARFPHKTFKSLPKGTKIHIKGTITEIDQLNTYLNDCELLP